MRKITPVLALLLLTLPSVSFATALTTQQSTSLIAVVQSSPGTPASAFVSLITSFSNITVNQATSLITVVQAAPGVPASAFVNLLTSFTVDTSATQPATPATNQAVTPTTSQSTTPAAQPVATTQPTNPVIQTPTYVMPDKPIIESFCDNKGNCVHSQFADLNSNSLLSTNPTIHVGETLSFVIRVSGEETFGVLAFIIPQGYDWLKEGARKPWSTNLTYTKTFSKEDISTNGYPIYAYIKSQNDNYHRKASCNWIDYSCDDAATLTYIVLP